MKVGDRGIDNHGDAVELRGVVVSNGKVEGRNVGAWCVCVRFWQEFTGGDKWYCFQDTWKKYRDRWLEKNGGKR